VPDDSINNPVKDLIFMQTASPVSQIEIKPATPQINLRNHRGNPTMASTLKLLLSACARRVGGTTLLIAALLALAVSVSSTQAANISKTDDANALNLPASWVGGVVPGVNDIAVFDATITAPRSPNLGASTNWSGIKVTSPNGAIAIGNSPAATLTLGNNGIDMSTATVNLTNSASLTLAAGNQVWNINSGTTLTLSSGATFSRTAGSSLNIQGSGTVSSSMTGLTNDASGPAPGIVGAWATVGTGSSTLYASTNTSHNIVGYTAGTSVTSIPAVVNPSTNFVLTSVGSAYGSNRRLNTFVYTGPVNAQGGSALFQINGFMNCGSGTLSWTVNTLTIDTNKNLVINAANADIVVSGVIVNCPGANGGASSLTKAGPNNLNLTGTSTYSGNTYVNVGSLFVNSPGSLNVTSAVVVATGATLGGSGLIKGPVTVNGNLAPGTNNAVGTLTISNNLTLASASATFQLGTIYNSGNDQVIVSTNLTLDSSDTIHISALGGVTNMDASGDYVLFAVGGTTTMSTTPALVWDGSAPANQSSFSLIKVGNNVVLHSSGTSITPANPIFAGTVVTLNANIVGASPFTYVWQSDGQSAGVTWTNIPGATTDPYLLNTTGWPVGTYQFRLVDTDNNSVKATNAPATMILLAGAGPILVTNTTIIPASAFILAGSNAVFSASFIGTLPLYYQWLHAGTNIPGATGNTLTLTGAQVADTGTYSLMASNNPPGLGPTMSNSATVFLYVVPQPENNTTVASIIDGGTSPFVGSYDIYQLTDAAATPPGLNYYVDNARPPGQIFTTGSTPPSPAGYPLNYVYVKHDTAGTTGSFATATTYTLYVYKMLDSTNAQLLTSYVTTNTLAFTAGDWVRVAGLTNVLATNTTYAFALHRASGYWRMACNVTISPGPNGQAASLPVTGGAATLSSPDLTFGYYYDAAFVAGLTPPSVPVVLADTTISPASVYNSQGPVTMQATFTGAAPIYYQWQHAGTNIPGATASSYIIPVASYASAGSYALLASNYLSAPSSVSSTPVTLTVSAPPITFTVDYAFQTSGTLYSGNGVLGTGTTWNRIAASGPATNQVSAGALADDGSTPLNMGFATYDSGNRTSVSTGGSSPANLFASYLEDRSINQLPITFKNLIPGVYNVVIYGTFAPGDGAVYRAANFSISDQAGLGSTNTQSCSNTVNTTTFSQGVNYALFSGITVSNTSLSGAWSAINTGTPRGYLNGAQLQMAYSFENPQIFIATQPAPVSVVVGNPASFSVGAIGPGTSGLPGPLFYQWRTNGVPIGGATNSTYAVADTSTLGTWSHDVVITNLTGLMATSSTATLTVGNPANLEWHGYASSAWDVSSANWFNLDTSVANISFANNDSALFDDNATSFTPSLNGVLTPSSVTVSAANNYDFTGSGYLSGSMSLTKANTGTLILETANNYTGATVISNGILQVGNGGTSGSIGTGPITNNGVLAFYSTATLAVTNTITGSGSLDMLASGTLTLTANNSFSGGVLQTNGVINASTNKALGSGSITLSGAVKRVVLASGVTITNSWTLSPGTGSGNTGRGLIEGPATAGTGSVTGPIYITAGPGTIGAGPASGGHFGGGSGNLFISGPITVDASTTWPFSRAGNVTLVPNAGSSYAVWQNEANIILGGNNALVTTAALYGNPGAGPSLDLNGYNQTLAAIYGIGPVANNGASSVTLTLTAGSAANAFSGAIHDNGVNKISIIVTGGTNILSGANSYTGNTTVNGGTLDITQATIATNSTVTVASGAVLQLDFTVTNRVGSLVLNGAIKTPGVYNNGTSPTYITGTGSLLVPSAGPSGPGSITNSVSGNILSLSWPAGQGWRLQGQTNSSSNGLGTNWGNVTGGSDGSISITIDPNQPTVFYRLVYP
jgi:autotransporter-associated beta strand protein